MANVQDIVQRIKSALRDEGGDNWTDENIAVAVYEAEKVIVTFRPDASPVDAELPCVPGIKQIISALSPSPNRLLSVKYNRAGNVDGRSVRRTTEPMSPNWRGATPSQVVREYMHDEREPHVFYVSPPADAGAKLQISYSAIPTAYSQPITGSTITTVGDLYEPMIIEWALYRLFGHDIEGSVNMSRSQQHLAAFQAMMGIKIQSDAQFSVKNPEFKR